jgi:hypothetical protein
LRPPRLSVRADSPSSSGPKIRFDRRKLPGDHRDTIFSVRLSSARPAILVLVCEPLAWVLGLGERG